MKILLGQLVVIICLFEIVNAKPGLPIPIPKLDAIHVIQQADSFLKTIPKDKWIDFDVREYIVLSVNYRTKDELEERNEKSEWFWVITFVHPIHTDHTYSFKIDNQNKITSIKATE